MPRNNIAAILDASNQSSSTFVLYANASSLLDHTNGASKSVRLILESLAQRQCTVHAVMGCTSDCKEGFKRNQSIWLKQQTIKNNNKLKLFTEKNVNYSLIATEHWSRRYVAADEQELIYRESLELITKIASSFNKKILIGWGNLLLEEAIINSAKEQGFKILFYLANPTYKGKNTQTITLASSIITDSKATKELYSDDIETKISVLPKCVEIPLKQQTAEQRWSKQTIIFVNPRPKKGLEALIIVANKILLKKPEIVIKIIDPGDKLETSLDQLGLHKEDLPENISVLGGFQDTDSLLSDASCLLLLSLWHESGSRLIHECHLRGIPILSFAAGGSEEFLSSFKDDLFSKPATTISQNGTVKITNWDSSAMVKRITRLLSNLTYYQKYNESLVSKSKHLYDNNTTAAEMILRM